MRAASSDQHTHLHVAVAEVHRQPLLASMPHSVAIRSDGGRRTHPARAIQPLLLKDVVLSLADPVVVDKRDNSPSSENDPLVGIKPTLCNGAQ